VVFSALFAAVLVSFLNRAALQVEVLALRHQLGVLHRSVKRPKLTAADPSLLGMAVGAMERLADSTGHRPAGNGDRLAQESFRLFWTWKVRSAIRADPP
jgi:hypothetical protein